MKPKIVAVDGGGANFFSVITALEKLECDVIVSNSKNVINNADGVILPGVGNAEFAMQKLNEYSLTEVLQNLSKPTLGICLGLQLLYEFSHEGNVDCLGIIPGQIKKITDPALSVPHMGWNSLEIKIADPILAGVKNGEDLYFVHSFYANVNANTLATCNYGINFSAVVKHNNFYGMQFHPEKPGKVGEKLLQNFINIVKNR